MDKAVVSLVATENHIMRVLDAFPENGLTGRRKIRANVGAVTRENVLDVYESVLPVHRDNAYEIDYLYDVYCGRQDVLDKVKYYRENINNKIIVNRANEIVTFKTAYLLSEPIQYFSINGDEKISERVSRLNEMMRMENKAAKDKEIVDWMHICGVGARLCLPDLDGGHDGAPFCVYTVDPRSAFVVYSADFREKPLCCMILSEDADGGQVCEVYTPDFYFKIKGGKIIASGLNGIGYVPLVEYVNNFARIGAFEVVLTILNAINDLESDAVDSVDDFVNGFDVFQNCDIEDESYKNLSLGGSAVKIKTVVPGAEAKVYRVYSELNQSGVQTRIDDLTDAYLEICGMPNRNGGLSTSDTGTAVLFRDGWSAADSRAKDTETLFKRSEREFCRIALRICEIQSEGKYDLKLSVSDFEPKFPRGNLSNLQSKVQVLCEMLNNQKIHPRYAFEKCGIFDDAEDAYRVSMEYYQEQAEKQEAKLQEELNNAREQALRAGGQDDSGAGQESDTQV